MQKHVPANVDAKAGARFFTQVPLGSILTLGCSLVLSEMSKKLNLTFFFCWQREYSCRSNTISVS